MDQIASIVASMLISGAPASDAHGCAERPHSLDDLCACTRVVDFYVPSTDAGYTPPGGWPPITVPAGPAIHIAAPGFRVVGRPINVAGPVIHIDGPPVYVDAPPIRIAPAQIYVERPDVHVRPSQILVEPPEVHFSDCADGTVCAPVDGDMGSSMGGYAGLPAPRVEAGAPPSVPVYTPGVGGSEVRVPSYAAAPSPAPVYETAPSSAPVYEAAPSPVLEGYVPPSSTRVPPPVPFYPPKQDRN